MEGFKPKGTVHLESRDFDASNQNPDLTEIEAERELDLDRNFE